MFCPSCGTEVPSQSKFCLACGKSIGKPSIFDSNIKYFLLLFFGLLGLVLLYIFVNNLIVSSSR